MKYGANGEPGASLWTGLIANANAGGENVHRGCVLGAILGAHAGVTRIPENILSGLHDREAIAEEIDAFVEALLPSALPECDPSTRL